jgi:hypothetical protein
MQHKDLMKQTRVQVERGRKRTWRTLWLRSEPDWDTVWYGVITSFSNSVQHGAEIVVRDQISLLKGKRQEKEWDWRA